MHTVQLAVEYYRIDPGGSYPTSVTLVSEEISPNLKNPFIPGGPVYQDEGSDNVAGVVEYKTEAPNDSYTITGLGKDGVL
jgi:hypothetical protein